MGLCAKLRALLSPGGGSTPASPEGVTISVQNLSTACTDAEAEQIAKALNVQATRDYNGSEWVTQKLATAIAAVKFIHKGEAVPADTWHLEILDTSDQPGALGYHEESAFDNKVEGKTPKGHFTAATVQPRKASNRSSRGLRADAPHLPLMKVFAKTCKEDGASLSEVCSHEMLEGAVDPRPGVEPRTVKNPKKKQIVIVEVGDPVQETGYMVEGMTMANFARPAWFGYPAHMTDMVDFCGVLREAFALTPGGYISVAPEDDPEAWTQEFGSKSAA